MEIIIKQNIDKLIRNGLKQQQAQKENSYVDFKPVLKIFTPDASATWLITEADPDHPDTLFGLCDLGLGFPELGYVSLKELESIRGKLGLSIERVLNFRADKPLSEYAEIARQHGRIIA